MPSTCLTAYIQVGRTKVPAWIKLNYVKEEEAWVLSESKVIYKPPVAFNQWTINSLFQHNWMQEVT